MLELFELTFFYFGVNFAGFYKISILLALMIGRKEQAWMSFLWDCLAISSILFYFLLNQSYSRLMKEEGFEQWKTGSGFTFGWNVHYLNSLSHFSLYLSSFISFSFYFLRELLFIHQNYLIIKFLKLLAQLLFWEL